MRQLRQYCREQFGEPLSRSSDAEVLHLIERQIEHGRLVCVEERKAAPVAFVSPGVTPSEPPEEPSEPTPPPAPPPAPAPPEQATTWYALRVVDEIGESIGGLDIVFSIGGREKHRITGGDGLARLDGVIERQASAHLADIEAARETLRPRWEQIRQGTPPDGPGVTVTPLHHPPVVPLLPENIHTLALTPSVVLARLLGLFFDTSKCFLLPCATVGLRGICKIYDEHPDAALLCVGHTDAAGSPSYNDPLSLERADAVAAYLTDDVEAWYAWYGYDKPSEKRWGHQEDALMLAALPDVGTCPADEEPLLWFQRTRGLEADGICGPMTRHALIRDYMAIDGTSLPQGISITTHGCGENFAAMPGEDDQPLNRRVELFFFDGDLLPTPPGKNSPPGSEIYPEWVRRALRTYTFLPGDTLGTYELRLTDEFGVPFEGLPVAFEVPGGPQVAITDADGWARVVAPSGGGTARVDAPGTLAPVLASRLDPSRETLALPKGDHVHYRVATRVAEPVAVVNGEPELIVIITRTDLAYPVLSTPWQDLELADQAGPWRLEPGSWTRLRLLGDGSGQEVGVVKPLEQEKKSTDWLRTLVDSVHTALFDGDFESVWEMLEKIPLVVPAPDKPPPDTTAEEADFAKVWAELTAEGVTPGPATVTYPEEPEDEPDQEDE
jgi:outer membrane protein OmpA-like peptidoglycan-associated protein